jgi:hypothetical protein
VERRAVTLLVAAHVRPPTPAVFLAEAGNRAIDHLRARAADHGFRMREDRDLARAFDD